MSIYIHIPFCSHICTYCDFPKVLKKNSWIKDYLVSLKREINSKYKGEIVDTIYIGGGTPSSLDICDLEELFDILKIFNLKEGAEISFEANSEDLSEEKLLFLKDKINRLSIGVQTFNEKFLKVLNRSVNMNNLKKAFKYFNNINLDLMYGFNSQSISDLINDLNEFLRFNPTHISTYSLIVEPNTKLYVDNYMRLDEDDDRKMYDIIVKTLECHGYVRYEISNFSKKGFESKHNLTYWNNESYYGFGLGAFGYVDKIRYENTRSLTNYLNGNYILSKHINDKNEQIQNELILGFRKIDGINKNIFKEKYQMDLKNIDVINDLLIKGFIVENETNIFINPDYIYISNEILVNFIDLVL